MRTDVDVASLGGAADIKRGKVLALAGLLDADNLDLSLVRREHVKEASRLSAHCANSNRRKNPHSLPLMLATSLSIVAELDDCLYCCTDSAISIHPAPNELVEKSIP